MVFCDNHSIYRTLRFIIKCGNGKSTATVTNGRLEGIWVFTNQTSIILYLAISMKMPKAPGSQSHQRRPKKKREIFKSIWVILSGESLSLKISLNISYPICFVRAGSPKLLMVEKSCRMWFILLFTTSFVHPPKKCCFARLLINMTQGFSILSQVVNAVAVTTQGPQTMQMSFRPSARWASRKVLGSGWFFGWNDPRFGRFFLESFLGNLWNVGPFTFCEATKPQMFVEILVFQSVEDTLRDEVFLIPNDISTTWKSGWASLLAIWKLPLITFARDSLRFASSMVGKSLFFFKWWLHDHVPWQKVRTISQKTNPRTWKTVQYSLIFQKASVFPVSAAFYGV